MPGQKISGGETLFPVKGRLLTPMKGSSREKTAGNPPQHVLEKERPQY